MDQHLLSIILLTPLAGLAVLLFIPGSQKGLIRVWANFVGLAGFLISLPLVKSFEVGRPGFQLEEKADWIPALGAHYHLGVDGISLLLIMLTTLVGFIAILSSWNAIEDRLKEYYCMFLLLQVGMLGVFMSLDFFLFYVFWELVLVPMYFIIAVWGGPRKLYAAIKFFLYTLAGSVLMLLGILTLYFQYASQFGKYTFEISELMKLTLPLGLQQWVFWAFFLGFAIKVPMFPFHTWLPDAHVEAPTAGSVMLAAVLLKLGAYGFIRFALPIFPAAARAFGPMIVGLSLIAIIYGAIVALVQPDWKKLIAYSSVTHMGFVTLGIFIFQEQGLQGAILQMINHGLITGGLFLGVGVMYERTHDRTIAKYGGLAGRVPVYAATFGFFTFASVGLPGLSGFVGEFLVLLGSFAYNPVVAAIATSCMILAAGYLLYMFQRIFTGELSDFLRGLGNHLTDISPIEMLTFVPLAALIVVFGLFPGLLLHMVQGTVSSVVNELQGVSAIHVFPWQ